MSHKKKRKLNRLSFFQATIIIYLVVIATFIVLVASKIDSRKPNILNDYYFSITKDDMSTLFSNGDVISTKKIAKDNIKENDLIAFYSRNSNTFSEIILSKVKLIDNISGTLYFSVESQTGNYQEYVSEGNVLGIYQSNLGSAAEFATFLNSVSGYIIFVVIPFIALFIITIFKVKHQVVYNNGGQRRPIISKEKHNYYLRKR